MKRILFLLIIVVPMLCSAQFRYKDVKHNPKYLTGAVSTTSNGMAYLQRVVNMNGMSTEQVLAEVDKLFGSVAVPARYVEVERTGKMRIYRIQDELVFRRNFLATNVATISARLGVSVSDGVCTITLDNIVYWNGNTASSTTTGMPHERWTSGWSVSDTGVEIITAEESITDKEAVKTDKLARWSAKYRVKTIDYIDSVAETLQKILDK